MAKETSKNFNENPRFLEARLAKGMTRDEWIEYFKEEAGIEISERMLALYENNSYLPNIGMVLAYCKVASCSVSFMLGRSDIRGVYIDREPNLDVLNEYSHHDIEEDSGLSRNTIVKYQEPGSYSPDMPSTLLISLSKGVHRCEDSTLGLIKETKWEEYVAHSFNFSYFVPGSVIVTTDKDGNKRYGLVCSDKNAIILHDGTILDAENKPDDIIDAGLLARAAGKIKPDTLLKEEQDRVPYDYTTTFNDMKLLLEASDNCNLIKASKLNRLNQHTGILTRLSGIDKYCGYYLVNDIAEKLYNNEENDKE